MKYVICVIDKSGKAYFGDTPTNKRRAKKWAKINSKNYGLRCFAVKYEKK